MKKRYAKLIKERALAGIVIVGALILVAGVALVLQGGPRKEGETGAGAATEVFELHVGDNERVLIGDTKIVITCEATLGQKIRVVLAIGDDITTTDFNVGETVIDLQDGEIVLESISENTVKFKVSGNFQILPPADKYVFLEIFRYVYGEVIEGENVRGPTIDGSSYYFDNNTGVLEGRKYFEVDENLLMVLGRGTALNGAAGSGLSCILTDVQTLPYEISLPSDKTLKITNLVRDKVSLICDGENTTVKSGERWEATIVSVGEHPLTKSKIRYETTITIVNYGLQDKDKLVLSESYRG